MGELMRSIRNHLSLVVALVSILFSLQVFVIMDRSIDAYKQKLSNNYSVVVVSNKAIVESEILKVSKLLDRVVELSPDEVIKRLDTGMSEKNIELLKLTLPKFYSLKLNVYPTPEEISDLTKDLLAYQSIMKVENFSHNHDTTYQLLLLFKTVIATFSVSIFIVTSLLIIKELRIWQFKHSERMNIMGLFGAPVWMRSAVLFRLAVVDAFIASFVAFILFIYFSASSWLNAQFDSIGISVMVFDPIHDFVILLSVAVVLSSILATMIVLGHKEEV